jgi:hypothetical protein
MTGKKHPTKEWQEKVGNLQKNKTLEMNISAHTM